MAPTRQSQSSISTRPILDKPQVLKTNRNATNISQNQEQISHELLNQLLIKLETLTVNVEALSTSVSRIETQIEQIKIEQRDSNLILERHDRNLRAIFEKLEELERTPPVVNLPATPVQNTINQIFTPEIILQARDQLGINLDVELVYNGKNLLSLVAFNRNNINIYGTKLLGKLFTKRELAQGTVEPTRTNTPQLDPIRMNLIKACYIRKLKTIESFVDNWPSISKSLKQKCLDQRKFFAKQEDPEEANGENGGEDDEDDNDDTQALENNFEQPEEEPVSGQLIPRDISMASLPLNN
ncbi:unnamed protein product [Brachionus calyciflorus]|uniref:BEN domain-containing protein n=1 Tax=Brachionus calyciflorus TaxID=104777 RepID=A0A814LZA9_9BILA|nr:unnamed protein product [Brachionus calyciflorus]